MDLKEANNKKCTQGLRRPFGVAGMRRAAAITPSVAKSVTEVSILMVKEPLKNGS